MLAANRRAAGVKLECSTSTAARTTMRCCRASGELLEQAGVTSAVELVNVPDDAAAQRERFLGSPTLRVDGCDVEPGADRRTDFGLKCPLYRTPDGFEGTPPDAWVLDALRRPGRA